MKNTITSVLVIMLMGFTTQTFAHEHQHNDSAKISSSDSLMQIEMQKHQQMEAVNAFPNYHPLVVHFPIVLLLVAVLFQLLSFFFLKKEFSIVTIILLALGVISAWLANNTFHADTGTLTGKAKEIFDTHEQMANLTWWFSLAALTGKFISHFFMNRKMVMEIIVSLLLIASGVTVSIAGHHGAMLVHMEGIGPLGKYLEGDIPAAILIDSTSINTHFKVSNTEGDEENEHHVGEIGNGPHGGTIKEADPFHIEIVAAGSDLVFYLLDGDANPFDMKDVSGKVKIMYAKNFTRTIELITMHGKKVALKANNGEPFNAVCTFEKSGKTFSATFNSKKDLPISFRIKN